MLRRAALALFAVAVLAAPTTAAQSRWREQVNAQLEAASRTLQAQGFKRTHDLYDGSLTKDSSEFLVLSLRGGTQYWILGACDNDCSDLDLRVYDQDNTEIDSDIETDDVPIVNLQASRDGKYRVKVIMAKCSTSPCFYGVGVYGK